MLLLGASISASAATPKLGGFFYGNATAPNGNEWQNPDSLAYNKEAPRATFYPFATVDNARKVLPEFSEYYRSLDGTWKFNWVRQPSERPADFFKPDYDTAGWDDIEVPSSWNIVGLQPDGSQRYGTPIYVNQPVIFMHERKVDDWRKGVMRTPPESWTTFNARNEVGSYRRDFTVPADWAGREVYITFDGVDSFFYLWINGHYVGFSKNSRNAARFNITRFLQKGENCVAVEVYRSSDGSFLEAQDMFRLPGIFRTVALVSTPKVAIRDLVAIPDLTDNYTNGELTITTTIGNLDKKEVKDYTVDYRLFANELYSDENAAVDGAYVASAPFNVAKNGETTSVATLKLVNPNKWSAEQPWRYTLVAQLKDKKGKTIETVSTYVGFRKVEIKDTPAEEDEFGLAGRYFYVNGMPVKLKGVNRHETNPERGHAITRDQMTEEVMMMKRANINHVRNSHYPDAPYWYYLADKYGIYLEDEANLESHEYYYGKESLSHPVEWRNAHVARNLEMAHSTVNSPSIVIWSLGNEAGPGDNFVAAYDSLKAFDTSRPVQYERNNKIVDIGSNQYPSIPWVEEAVKGTMKIKYPFHISEYAHSMGNAMGNLVDYWNAIESTNFFMGGAIWDWVDQSLYNYDKATGTRYLAYGGDFGDTPNDGQFVMNGIVFGDLTPKPQYAEVKKVYQNVGVKPYLIEKGQIEVFNKNYFAPLAGYDIAWTLLEDGVAVDSGAVIGPTRFVEPRGREIFTVPFKASSLKPDKEYFVDIEFRLSDAKPWASAGYPQMAEQILVKRAGEQPSLAETTAGDPLWTATEGNMLTITGRDFCVEFDNTKGTLNSLVYGSTPIIVPGNGPKLDAFRAFVNNDNWIYTTWFENGLHNLRHKVLAAETLRDASGNMVVAYTVESQAPNGAKILGGTSSGHNRIEELADAPFGPTDFKFITNQIWTIYRDGTIELQSAITSNNGNLTLPRLGYEMKVNPTLDNFTYYGRGPVENYADRKTGSFIGRYSSKVVDQPTPYTKPQNMSNHEDVRWVALTDNAGNGAMFIAPEGMSATALPYDELDFVMAAHPFELPAPSDTRLHLDLGMTGLGGTSCGQDAPFESDRVKATAHNFSVLIRPLSKELTFDTQSAASPSGMKPIALDRDRKGRLQIVSPYGPEATVFYTVDGAKKPKVYTGPFDLKDGGTVKAWLKSDPRIKAETTFPVAELIDIEVVNFSSQEPGEEAANLVDGNPATNWNTTYSVTVAAYPHYVDFDAGESRLLKGVTYLPRQDTYRGIIRDYEVYVSDDLQNWGEPVAKGRFPYNLQIKTVKFDKPAKGRYVRFQGLNAQDGQDYAGGAEFTVLQTE